jgi:hypothetical protein
MHAYVAAGTYTVTLRVTDNQGATAQAQRSVTVSAPPPPVASVMRWEESDSRIIRGPNAWTWGEGANAAASGGRYLASATSGATLRATFSGTGIKWIGVSDSCSGRAQVAVDGVVQVIDTYRSPSSGWKSVTYSVTGLAATTHTMVLTILGTKQAASCGAWVYFDAFDVIGSASVPPPPLARVRLEESSAQIVRGPDAWSWGVGSNAAASGGAFLASGTAGATLTLTFTGTGFSLIGTVDTCSGQANVTVDGIARSVDFYRTQTGWQQAVYQLSGLARAQHTIRVQVTGAKNSASCGPWIYVDAIEVVN